MKNYELIRKNIKHMYLRVKPPHGRVVVSAPKKMPQKDITAFISSRAEWIKTQQDNFSLRPAPLSYKTGELVPLWGTLYPLELVQGATNSLLFLEERFILTTKDSEFSKREELFFTFYRKELQRALAGRVPYWSGQTGLFPTEVRIRKMSTRWGSCNPSKKRIWVSLFMAKKPLHCLDYLLIHELCHLVEGGHNKRFWSKVEEFYPHWKSVRKELNTPY